MGRKSTQNKKDFIIQTRINKNYNEELEALMSRNKRTKADMVRIIIENFIDMKKIGQ